MMWSFVSAERPLTSREDEDFPLCATSVTERVMDAVDIYGGA